MGIADDYADMARAALQLREVTGDDRFLIQARAWTQVLDTHFWNNQIGGPDAGQKRRVLLALDGSPGRHRKVSRWNRFRSRISRAS